MKRKITTFSYLLFGILFLTSFIDTAQAQGVMGDITFQRQGEVVADETPAAVFPHWIHRVRYKCYVCHSQIYQMTAGADQSSMEEIIAGKSCGVCHNGEIAWNIDFGTCPRCHKAEQ